MIPLVTIIGPTAVGKSDCAVSLAHTFGGEVVSADSRQVYRGLDIGSGKITKDEMKGIPHHLIDIASPRRRLTVAEYKIKADRVIATINERDALPFLVGGTGFYIQAVVDNITPPAVPPDPYLRTELEKKDTETLAAMLRQHHRRRYNEIHKNDRTRIIRALEIVMHLGDIPEQTFSPSPYNTCIIGLDCSDTQLRTNIHKRLIARLDEGMIEEITNLHTKGVSWKRMEELGLEYRYGSRYARGKLSHDELIDTLNAKIWQFAKRQRMWFRRDTRITWFEPDQLKEITKHLASWQNCQS